ncbi:unnamed protein product [Protopolystoma xenopodis]|uniref:Uncharacterized protein n=1 Tax=Protopolystoma xenopodis TaxID=117903 RepID=A0A3S5AYE6_9PLAT|nr:unnamed protein product [Protopolystoma xenopodis]
MARLTDDADYDAGEMFKNVSSQLSDPGNQDNYYGRRLRTRGIHRRLLVKPTLESLHPALLLEMKIHTQCMLSSIDIDLNNLLDNEPSTLLSPHSLAHSPFSRPSSSSAVNAKTSATGKTSISGQASPSRLSDLRSCFFGSGPDPVTSTTVASSPFGCILQHHIRQFAAANQQNQHQLSATIPTKKAEISPAVPITTSKTQNDNFIKRGDSLSKAQEVCVHICVYFLIRRKVGFRGISWPTLNESV